MVTKRKTTVKKTSTKKKPIKKQVKKPSSKKSTKKPVKPKKEHLTPPTKEPKIESKPEPEKENKSRKEELEEYERQYLAELDQLKPPKSTDEVIDDWKKQKKSRSSKSADEVIDDWKKNNETKKEPSNQKPQDKTPHKNNSRNIIIAVSVIVGIIGLAFVGLMMNNFEQQQLLQQERIQKQEQQAELVQKQQQIEKQKSIAAEQQRQAVEQERQAELERQRILEAQRLENERNKIRVDAQSYPIVKGVMNGQLTFYVDDLPSYASQDVRTYVEALASWMDGKSYHGVKLKRSYSSSADITINWVKDYQEEAIGRQVGDYLIVGLGKNNCKGEWRPFTGYSVYKIMWHEVGHSLGYAHVKDTNNIMYHQIDQKYQYDYDETLNISDGSWTRIYLCQGGDTYYSTERVGSSGAYKVYLIGSGVNPNDVVSLDAPFYLGCSFYEDNMINTYKECRVESGSSLVIYNPSVFGMGSDVRVNVKIYDYNDEPEPDMSLLSSNMFFSESYFNNVRQLFN